MTTIHATAQGISKTTLRPVQVFERRTRSLRTAEVPQFERREDDSRSTRQSGRSGKRRRGGIARSLVRQAMNAA